MSKNQSRPKSSSVTIEDNQLVDYLENHPDPDALVESALSHYKKVNRDKKGLNDEQKRAYQWLIDNHGEYSVELEIAKNRLAQVVGINAGMVKSRIIHPLNVRGYVNVHTGLDVVTIRAVGGKEL